MSECCLNWKLDPLAGLKKDNAKGESPLAKALKAIKDPYEVEEYDEIIIDRTSHGFNI